MASTDTTTICLFDVDGTLTPSRNVSYLSKNNTFTLVLNQMKFYWLLIAIFVSWFRSVLWKRLFHVGYFVKRWLIKKIYTLFQRVQPEMQKFLQELSKKVVVGVVSGSDLNKIAEQLTSEESKSPVEDRKWKLTKLWRIKQ